MLFAAGGAAVVAVAFGLAGTHADAAAKPKGVTLCATRSGAVKYSKTARCPKNDKILSVGTQKTATATATKTTALMSQVTMLEAQVTSLRTEVNAVNKTLLGVTRTTTAGVPTLTFAGENVQIVNGTGSETTTNGLGNLILGYDNNEDGLNRSGSHNLIAGDDNGYSSVGGIVAGYGNLISGLYASAIGGNGNTASGEYTSVSGGTDNLASGKWATVIGGDTNRASGPEASIAGGILNTSSGSGASILGGYNGTVATDNCASIPTTMNTSTQCAQP